MKRRYRLIEKTYPGGDKMWQGEMTMKEKLFWILYSQKWVPISISKNSMEDASQDISNQMKKDYNAKYPQSERVLEEYVRNFSRRGGV